MASFLGSSNNSKKSVASLRGAVGGLTGDTNRNITNIGPTNEQKAAHIESLLRKLYAKVDELETVCKEEKEFHQVLKSRGCRGLPKLDNDLLNRVVASQQRCAESAFNKLDMVKRNNPGPSGKSMVNSHYTKEEDTMGKYPSDKGHRPHISTNKTSVPRNSTIESHKANEYANYGSLDRNFRKKKGAFAERNRRTTKTLGSLAVLDVDESLELLKPDEQYKYGLPTVDTTAATFAPILVSSTPHQLFSINSARPNDQITSHGALNWQPQQPVPSLAVTYDGFLHHHHQQQHQNRQQSWQHLQQQQLLHHPHHHQPVIHHRRSVSQDRSASNSNVKHFEQHSPPLPPVTHQPNLEPDTAPVPASAPNQSPPLIQTTNSGPTSPFNDQFAGTDLNFNRLTISSPTDGISERSSSKSSENDDLKNGYINESSKPFEMSDYYKYSTKYRFQGREKVASSKSGSSKLKRVNGMTNADTVDSNIDGQAMELHSSKSKSDMENSHLSAEKLSSAPSTAPKLPPKLRPMNIMYKPATDANAPTHVDMHKRKHEAINNNPGPENLEAWMFVNANPTIV